jgi:hypothetical protein
VATLAAVIAARRDWLAASLDGRESAARLGWTRPEFEQVIRRRSVQPGRFGRFAVTDIEVLAHDETLAGESRGNRLLGPDQAAEHLEIAGVRAGSLCWVVTALPHLGRSASW